MTIAYIANIRLPTEKAHGVQIMKMCEAFAKLGHAVVLVVPERRNAISANPFEYYGINPSFKIVTLPCLDGVRFWGKIGFLIQALSFTRAARKYVSRTKPDMLYTRDPEVVARLAARGHQAIWEVHTATHGLFVGRAVRIAKKIVAISDGLKKVLMERGIPENKILVAHDAVDLAEYEINKTKEEIRADLGLPQARKILEYVGKFHTMGHSKGVEELVQIIGAVAKRDSNILLLLVGIEPQDIERVKAIAEEAQLLPEQYQLVGHVPRREVPAYLHAADLLLMNYPSTTHYAHIMSPLKVFEYMASGVPIITTDLPSLREVLTNDDAHFVPPGNIDAFSKGIETLLRDTGLALTLGQHARETAKRYSWSSRAERILQCINA